MKKLLYGGLVCMIVLVAACEPKPEGYKDGKPFITRTHCVRSHEVEKWGYHYGYNVMKGEMNYHYGRHSETVCDEQKTDTIFLKVKKTKNVVN
ncbi:MAG: hypothetical protein WCJ45_06445 [bacterium]